jgi:hypothetical protein
MHDPVDHQSAFLDETRPLDLIVRVCRGGGRRIVTAMSLRFP